LQFDTRVAATLAPRSLGSPQWLDGDFALGPALGWVAEWHCDQPEHSGRRVAVDLAVALHFTARAARDAAGDPLARRHAATARAAVVVALRDLLGGPASRAVA